MSRFFESIIFLQILCSISTSEAYHRHKRIIDGEATQINYYPHQVSLRMVQNDRHYCGGAVISENWILSAGQCTQGEKSSIENIYIVAGATNITSGGQRFDLDLIVTHPNFNWAKRENDISMLRTQQPMPLIDNRIFPIALPSYATDYKMENNIGLTYVTISGWGVFDVSFYSIEIKTFFPKILINWFGSFLNRKIYHKRKMDCHRCCVPKKSMF